MEGRRERQASIHPTRAHSFVASKYCKWRKGSRPRKGSRSVALRGRLAYILQRAHSFVASKYCKWRKGSRPRKGSRSVAWLDGMVETLVSARKALEPTSYPRLQDFLGMLQTLKPTPLYSGIYRAQRSR